MGGGGNPGNPGNPGNASIKVAMEEEEEKVDCD